MTAGEQEYEKVIEEYEEEVFVQEEASEPPTTDIANNPSVQGKPRCITIILNNHWIYICDVHLCYRNFMKTTCINISVLRVLLV